MWKRMTVSQEAGGSTTNTAVAMMVNLMHEFKWMSEMEEQLLAVWTLDGRHARTQI